MDKKKIFRKICIAFGAVLFAVAAVAAFLIGRDKILQGKARALEEKYESERLEAMKRDLENFMLDEYDSVMLSMCDPSDWDVLAIDGYIGVDMKKNETVINSGEELINMWAAAIESGNSINYAVLVIDPYKLCVKKEYEEEDHSFTTAFEYPIEFEDIFLNFPNVDFRVLMPFYSKDYWVKFSEDDTLSEAVATYEIVMNCLLDYDNVTLSCFSQYKWLTDNPSLFNENGSLKKDAFLYFFLSNYKDYWKLTRDELFDVIESFYDNQTYAVEKPKKSIFERFAFWHKEEPSVSYEIEGLNDCDVVFFGDSIFALNDGPFSIASCFENLTGARTYNISKGGITAAKFYDEVPSMPELVDSIASNTEVNAEGFEVFNRELQRFYADDHTGRRVIFVTDFGTNDYLFGVGGSGNDEYSYDYALKEAFDNLKAAFSDARFASFSVYHILDCDSGNLKNDSNLVLADYKKIMEDVSREKGVFYMDMSKLMPFTDNEAGYYLDDGIHPSAAGSYEAARALADALSKLD